MHATRHTSRNALVLLGLAAACGDPAGPPSPYPDAALAKLEPTGAPLQIQTEYELQTVDEQSVRERVEVRAYFSGADPINPQTGLPLAPISLIFAPNTIEYETQEKEGGVGARVESGWEVRPRDGGYHFEVKDPQAVHDAVKVQVFESGQVVDDVTGYIAAAEGNLFFNPDLKLWELRLALTGVTTPSGIVTPTKLKTFSGSAVATLQIDQTEFTTRIRENEATFPSPQLVLNAETKQQDAGSGFVQETFALGTRFTSNELDPFSAQVDYFLALQFEINFAGVVGPPCIQIGIPPGAWVQGDGGGFKIEEPDGQSAGINFLVVQNGQVVADLTDRIGTLAASLHYVVPTKSWDLKLEIDGVVTPSDVHVPILAPLAGARTATIDIGHGLEQSTAPLGKSEAIF